MRAVVAHAPHDLRLEQLPEVADPGEGEVLVRVVVGGICGSDLHYYHHGGFGTVRLREPMILGHEVSAVITAVGEGVTRVSPGDLVALNPLCPVANAMNAGAACATNVTTWCSAVAPCASRMRRACSVTA